MREAVQDSDSLPTDLDLTDAELGTSATVGAASKGKRPHPDASQTTKGDIELAFYPEVAPKTVEHMLMLFRLGAFNTNHIFRVDRGFVAQVADCLSGRTAPMDARQRKEASLQIPGEFSPIKHVKGTLSMARYNDPNSATSSFSMLLGPAPHLDGQYAVFGTVTKGFEALEEMEKMETTRQGIFVMPKERITILSTYVYDSQDGGEDCTCCARLQRRLDAQEKALQDARKACLP
eukprot:jgi/Mesvir1/8900/Mv02782-RA.1